MFSPFELLRLEAPIRWYGRATTIRVKIPQGGERTLKKDVCRASLAYHDFEGCALKKALGPCQRRDKVDYICRVHEVSLSRACGIMNLSRSFYRYRSRKDDSVTEDKVIELALKRPDEGQDKIFMRIREQGLMWNKKRVRRVNLNLKLNKRIKIRKRVPARVKEPLFNLRPTTRHGAWTLCMTAFTTDENLGYSI